MTMRGLPRGSGTEQTYSWWVWPVTRMSTSGLMVSAMSTIGPDMPTPEPSRDSQSWPVSSATGSPPSWRSTTIELTPLRLSSLAYSLAVSTSSRNSRPSMPDWETMSPVPSRVMPMKPTLTPWPKFLIQ